jgi:hypothetical protein
MVKVQGLPCVPTPHTYQPEEAQFSIYSKIKNKLYELYLYDLCYLYAA